LVDIRAEIQADARLDCDPRRKLKDVKQQLEFEYYLSKKDRSRDRRYLLAGGLSRAEVSEYYRTHDRKVQ
jgi:hypothetical protein